MGNGEGNTASSRVRRREDFRNQQRSERRHNKFTLLIKSPKEILALDKGWKDVARNQGAQARQPKGSAKSSKEGINIQRGLASGNLDGSTMAKGCQTKDYAKLLYGYRNLVPTPRGRGRSRRTNNH
ncbi:hypothetical protein Tco_0132517 [Tanacetum coccineum]